MINKNHADLIIHLVEAKILMTEPPFEETTDKIAEWARQIGRDTVDNLERFSDFMEWNHLQRNDLKERIRTGLYMDYHYRHPKGLGQVKPSDAALWALEVTELIIICIGCVMRLYSNLLE